MFGACGGVRGLSGEFGADVGSPKGGEEFGSCGLEGRAAGGDYEDVAAFGLWGLLMVGIFEKAGFRAGLAFFGCK